jgi:uncharacterized protein YgiM (DUF1202 family)
MTLHYRRMRTVLSISAAVALLSILSAGALGAQAKGEAIQKGDRVRVPTSYANVHMGPSSGQQVLVLVPKGTELTVTDRRGEWIQVQLTPDLRKTGMVMRWYKNETHGWMHDSTVERLAPGTK